MNAQKDEYCVHIRVCVCVSPYEEIYIPSCFFFSTMHHTQGEALVDSQNANGQLIVDAQNANGQAIVDARNATCLTSITRCLNGSSQVYVLSMKQ